MPHRPARVIFALLASVSHGERGRLQANYGVLLAERVQLRAQESLRKSPVKPFETAADVLRFMRAR